MTQPAKKLTAEQKGIVETVFLALAGFFFSWWKTKEKK